MASVTQSDESGTKDEITQPPDLPKVGILGQTDWLRIQDEINGIDKDKERLREAAKHREALQLQSKEFVKMWPDTIASQRQNMLVAKKVRELMEEEKMKLIEAEEAQYKKEKQKEALKKAKTQLYYQNDRVKALHRALLHTEVLKEREAQTELKKRRKMADRDMEKKFLEITSRETETSRKEQERQLQKIKRQAVAEDQKNQIKANEVARELQKLEIVEEAKEIQLLQERYQQEQKMESERRANQRRDLFHAHLDQLNKKALKKEQEEKIQKAEEERRRMFNSVKEQRTKLQQQREKELFREAQKQRERILNNLTTMQQEQTAIEEQRLAEAVAVMSMKQRQQQQEKERKKSEMLKTVAEQMEIVRKKKELLEKSAEQERRDALQAKKEADLIYTKTLQLKAEKMREEQRKLKEFYVAQMAEKSTRLQQMKDEELNIETKNAKQRAEEEAEFEKYTEQVIQTAADAKRNLIPLYRAVRKGGSPSYIVQDSSGAQMPRYTSATTQSIRRLHEAGNIHESKKRLGFTWC
ncbi:PREDICTED: coiled-coil domain-containing protein 173 [Cyprinodon variegatus]|uniref:coiled-coil domain-containing protein 173 n=1 Tax=Cyprinodon variegatus TaxID=28743 RepID=UPI0007428782|nr:PREDICTED: coiled-coil domain-containing protein 173 [Cyprinodon variegatus]